MPLNLDLFEKYSFDNSNFNEISTLIISSSEDSFSPVQFENLDVPIAMPSAINLVPLTDIESTSLEVAVPCRELVQEIEEEYGLMCTVAAYYPPEGFIGWHTNENVEMYNAICTYSYEGNSYFEYEDQNNKVVRVDDTPGWTTKITKWGKDEPVNHRAVSDDHRITFTFSHKEIEPINRFVTEYLGIT